MDRQLGLTTNLLFPYAPESLILSLVEWFMRRLSLLIFCSSCCVFLCQAENRTLLIPQSSLIDVSLPLAEDDEIKVIDQLIAATTSQLETQKHLRVLMIQFKKQREEFVQGNQTKAHAGKMVRTARQIYEIITANHLEHLFAKDYLDELTFFSFDRRKNCRDKAMTDILYFDRKTQRQEKEKVYGRFFLELLYGDGVFARMVSFFLLPLF